MEQSSETTTLTCETVYQERLTQRKAELAQFVSQENLVGTGRVLSFFIAAFSVYAVIKLESSPLWVAGAVIVLMLVVQKHRGILKSVKRAQRCVQYYQRCLKRLAGDWSSGSLDGEEYLTQEHLYARDLDLFGNESLFQFTCMSRTRFGQKRFAEWLLNREPYETILSRQKATQELAEKIDLREKLAILDEHSIRDIDAERLNHWLEKPSSLPDKKVLLAAGLLGCGMFLIVLGMIFANLPVAVFLVGVVIELGLLGIIGKQSQTILQDLGEVEKELAIFSQVTKEFESQSFETEALQEHVKQLHDEDLVASQAIDKFVGLAQHEEASRMNQLYAAFAIVFMIRVYFLYAIESWRLRHSEKIQGWLNSVADLECLCSVSCYAYEHEELNVWPEFENKSIKFVAKELKHPLLKDAVSNDVDLGDPLKLLLVSGSNMSGKSTMLRTIGQNVILAMIGAPVCAKSLNLSIFSLASSMVVSDSLKQGVSHFYAEIQRLKAITDLSEKDPPVLFLLDEILHGTNSADRKAGAAGVIRYLLERNSIGLVTTHDLSLTEIVDEWEASASNVHFIDTFKEDGIEFDYKMRSGIVTEGNGVRLMRLMGLDV